MSVYQCSACGGPTSVLESRKTRVGGDTKAVRRRRKCYRCGEGVTTYEMDAVAWDSRAKKLRAVVSAVMTAIEGVEL